MYTVTCKNCGSYYESGRNVSGVCPNCKANVRGKNNTRYREKTYDNVMFYVPKGQREVLKEYAKGRNMSMNEFINNAIEHYMQALEEKSHEPDEEISLEDVPF